MKFSGSLRHELVLGLAAILVVALALSSAVLLWAPAGSSVWIRVGVAAAVILVTTGAFVALGDALLRRRITRPVRAIVEGAEAIAQGQYSRRLSPEGPEELKRVAGSVNEIAERLILNQQRLAENIQSLEEVNRELTEARDELVRAEKLASVGQLAAGLAHEIGNPLGAVLGYLEVAERRPKIGPDLLKDMRREAQRIDRIVKGLLDYARPRQPAPKLIDVNEVVGGAVELLDAQGCFKEIEVVVDAEDVPSVQADPHQLEQILVNLLLNAAQVADGESGHRIDISTDSMVYESSEPPARRRDDPPGIDYSHLRRLQARREGMTTPPFHAGQQVVRISVVDDGPGIPEDIIDRVFDPFFSTKEPGRGTGLGLAVSARLIEGMGGAIEVESSPEGGANFSVFLPAANSGGSA